MPQGKGGGPKPGFKSHATRKREADEDDPNASKRQARKANFFTPRVNQDRHSELEALEAVAAAPPQDEEDTAMRDAGVFTGLRVFMHEGIGPGKLYSAQQCSQMWEADGLCPETSFLLKQAGSTLPPSHPARVRAEGGGARLICGESHRAANLAAAQTKRQAKEDAKAAQKDAADKKRAVICSCCCQSQNVSSLHACICAREQI